MASAASPFFEPFLKIERFWSGIGERVACKQIWNYNEVSSSSKTVCKQFGVANPSVSMMTAVPALDSVSGLETYAAAIKIYQLVK
jgi:hypothetical protein